MDGGAGGTGALGGTSKKTAVTIVKASFFHIQLWRFDVKYCPLTAGAHTDPSWNVTCGRRPQSVLVMQYKSR